MHKICNQLPPISHIVSALALLLLVVAVYYPGLFGPFILDDFSNIVENEAVHMGKVDFESLAEAATAYGDSVPHRPVSTVSLALDYRQWGDDPFGFKVTNLIIHLLTFVFLFLLARQLFRLTFNGRSGSQAGFWPALAIAGLWAIHPLQVSTVLYVVQRMEMLAAMFIVLSLLAYVLARIRMRAGVPGGGWLLATAGACTLLALFSKETGVLAPFFMLAIELLVFRFDAHRPRTAHLLKLGFGAIVSGALLLYLFWMVPEFIFGDRFVTREFTWHERLLTQLRVLPMYIGWILFPATDQYLFYYDHFAYSEGLLNPPTTIFGGLVLAVLMFVAWRLRRRSPLAALGILWFFIAHALTSNVFSLELVFEHRNYLALFALLLALTAVCFDYVRSKISQKSALAMCAVLALGLGTLTAIRSATWGDEMNLALHHVHINPKSERAGLDLAELYLGDLSRGPGGSPFLSSARSQFERVARLPNARTTADQALILLAAQIGEPTPDDAWYRLIHKVRTNALNSADYDALYNLVQRRYQGIPISDERLWQLHSTLCKRSDIPAQIHARFGYYAALVLEDLSRATSAFLRALVVLSDKPDERRALERSLDEAGIELEREIRACEDVPDKHQG